MAVGATVAAIAVSALGLLVITADAGHDRASLDQLSRSRSAASRLALGVGVPAPPAGARSGRKRQTSLQTADRLASKFDLTLTSGYRDPSHNAEVGGVEGSYHTRGTVKNPGAVDLVGRHRTCERRCTGRRNTCRAWPKG